MAQPALSEGTPRKRALFGLLDADGWTWASVKAAVWLVIIILLLGYLPDRAYYFTVFPTIDLGVNPAVAPSSYVTPINLCPPKNEDLPCPAPGGALLPWQLSPTQVALPAPRTEGAAVQVGTKLLYIGGSDGSKAVSDVFVAEIVGGDTFDRWQPGPALPAPRKDAAVTFSNGTIYVIGGADAAGAPSTTVYELTPDTQTGDLGSWTTDDALALPAPRSGAAVAVGSDGLYVVGGSDASGAPTTTAWKSTLDATSGKLGAWTAQQPLTAPRTGALADLVGNYLWLYGGADANGPTTTVLRGLVQTSAASSASPAPSAAAPTSGVVRWDSSSGAASLPAPRVAASGFLVNGAIYLIGGSDGTAPKGEVYWAVPNGNGDIAKWQHLPQSDLPAQGLQGGAAAVTGSTAFVVGGESSGGPLASSVRADLSPGEPFFQLGLLGATVPALKIEGEIGQQLGFLNAAFVGTADFVLLLLIGWALAHKSRTRALLDRIRRRRRA